MSSPPSPPPIRIPFNRSSTMGKELQYIAETLQVGQIAGDQAFTRRCEAILEEITGARRALLTTSCTHALELAAYLLEPEPGDEVLVPAFTFVSTANAFLSRGAKPVFVDIRSDTLNVDEGLLEDLITPRTKAVVPVHYGGVGCEMDAIQEIADRHGLVVIEDNAHGLFGKYRGRSLGTLGGLAAQSFHETKNITCGEGGALLLNDDRWLKRAEVLREKGTDRSRFFRGEIERYTWVDEGSSYVMSDVLAAFLYGQLEQWRGIQQRRSEIWSCYNDRLADWAETNDVRPPVIPAHCEQAYHLYYMLMPSDESRQGLISHLRAQGILAVFHYLPLNQSPVGRRLGGGECPVAEDTSRRLVRLPFYNEISEQEQSEVIETILRFSP